VDRSCHAGNAVAQSPALDWTDNGLPGSEPYTSNMLASPWIAGRGAADLHQGRRREKSIGSLPNAQVLQYSCHRTRETTGQSYGKQRARVDKTVRRTPEASERLKPHRHSLNAALKRRSTQKQIPNDPPESDGISAAAESIMPSPLQSHGGNECALAPGSSC
jgi:hypothetical protein